MLCDGLYDCSLNSQTDDVAVHCSVLQADLGKDIDLSALPTNVDYYWLVLTVKSDEGDFELDMEFYGGELDIYINDREFEESPFAAGSILKFSVEDGVATVSIDGTLRQGGKAVKLHAKAPVDPCAY